MVQAAAYQELKKKFTDKSWRMDNLYYIQDKAGNRVLFKMNWAQRILCTNMWFMNIILKARQVGMSTYICIWILDELLFNSYKRAGIIAHTRDDAEEIFETKIKFPYDNLPEELKRERAAYSDSSRKLKFANHSSIKVGTSMRSGTLNYLHISEHGKICAKYPEKAKEIRTGSLNTVHIGQIIFIESTAEGTSGDFHDMCTKAQQAQDAEKKLTELDFKFHFFPWWKEPTYELDPEDMVIISEMQEYFDELKERNGIVLSDRKKAWYVKKWETQQDEMKREYPSTPEEAFEASIVGAWYASQMRRMRKERRICDVPHDEGYLVHTAWDIGVSVTAIWFFQVIGHWIHFIDYFEDSDEGLPYYKLELQNKAMTRKFIYGTHFGPHDIEDREWSSGTKIVKKAQDVGVWFFPLPKTGLVDGINMVRAQFSRTRIDQTHCDRGIRVLDNYVKDWNRALQQFKDRPPKDHWANHGADTYRYGHQAVGEGYIETVANQIPPGFAGGYQTPYGSIQDLRDQYRQGRSVYGI